MPVVLSLLLLSLITSCDLSQYGINWNEISDSEHNVVFVTLDGVRWQELFNGADRELGDYPVHPFTRFWSRHVPEGMLIGNPEKGGFVTVANGVNISLPGYQTIALGEKNGCFHNDCGRVAKETFFEFIKKYKKLERKDVAAFSSWKQIRFSLENTENSIFSNTGIESVTDNETLRNPEAIRANKEQHENLPPWGRARWDRYTFALGLSYLQNNHPRLFYLSFNDADSEAHRLNYPGYFKALERYDDYLDRLFEVLDNDPFYSNRTLVIVTTDHGRGKSKALWHGHGPHIPESKHIWMYLRGPGIRAIGATNFKQRLTHQLIRPLIELSMGVRAKFNEFQLRKLIFRQKGE